VPPARARAGRVRALGDAMSGLPSLAATPIVGALPELPAVKRVTDEDVRHALAWARNYGDVEDYERIGARGAKWLVRLTLRDVSIDHVGRLNEETLSNVPPLLWPRVIDHVPAEMVLTNREVLLLVYGLAAGGERDVPRSAYREHWERGEKYARP
jgi:hypothetical protein